MILSLARGERKLYRSGIETAGAIDLADAEKNAFTIREFCRRNGMSTPLYYEMRQAGLGPKEMRYGQWVRISREAELEWQRRMENPTGEAAEAVEAEREALRERARRAVAGRQLGEGA